MSLFLPLKFNKILLLCIAWSVAVIMAPQLAQAQQKDPLNSEAYKAYDPYITNPNKNRQGENYLATAHYNHMVRQALKHQADNFNFGHFRTFYSETEQYDPLAIKAGKQLLYHAYNVQTEESPEKQKEALNAYTELLVKHMANIDMVTRAYILSKDDKRFGDHKFFSWLIQGLLKSVRESGDGTRLTKAYDAMTMGEETALLNSMNIDIIRTISANQDRVYYNIHDVIDRDSGHEYSIFVDISKPMRYLEQQALDKKYIFDIPRQ